MNRRDFATHLGLAAAAASLPGLALAQGAPTEGKEYIRLGQAQPTTPGKIEVLEFFWYGCPHCYAFEPILGDWAKTLPADVVLKRAHVMFGPHTKVHQQMFYALEAMGKETQVRGAIFNAIHRGGQRLDQPDAAAAFLATVGIDRAKFLEAFNSFGVAAQCRQAAKLQEAYKIDGVPTVGVGGRYVTSPSMAGGEQRLNEVELGNRAIGVMNFLVQKVRKGA